MRKYLFFSHRFCLAADHAPATLWFANVRANVQIVYGLFMKIKTCCTFSGMRNGFVPRLMGEDAGGAGPAAAQLASVFSGRVFFFF